MASFRFDLFSEVGSDLTSSAYLTADAEEMTVQAKAGSATTLTIQGSNATGFRTAIAEGDWSSMTVITGVATSTIYNVEPGQRWMRLIRESATSLTEATIAGRNVGMRGRR